jgi:hypothetical protein
MKTAAQLFGEVQMILARRLAGELNDSETIERISDLMDSDDAVTVSLDLAPDPGQSMDGEGSGGQSQH